MRRWIALAAATALLVGAAPAAAAGTGSASGIETPDLERLYEAWSKGLAVDPREALPKPGPLPKVELPKPGRPSLPPPKDPKELLPPLPELPELKGPGLVEEHFGDWSNVREGLEAALPAPKELRADFPSETDQRRFLDNLPALSGKKAPSLKMPALDPAPKLPKKKLSGADPSALARDLGLSLTPAEKKALDAAGKEWSKSFESRIRSLDSTLESFQVPAKKFPAAPKPKGIDFSRVIPPTTGEALKAKAIQWKDTLWQRGKSLWNSAKDKLKSFTSRFSFWGR
ncbi:MAG TPA: hypothetical protein VIK99_03730 [Thermaerobacter sp.]